MNIYGRQYLICFFAYIGQILFGYTGGWTAPMFSKLQDPEQFPHPPNDLQANWLVAITFLGSFVGAVILSRLSNVLGRKPCLVIGGVSITLSYLGKALIKNIAALLTFRFILGVGIATVFSVNLVYIGEIASTEIRGKLLGSFIIFNSMGFLLVYVVGGFASYEAVNYFAMALGLVYLCGLFFAPESPIYHLIKGREEEARVALMVLKRKEDAEKISEIKAQIEKNKNTLEWRTLFMVKCNRKALIITTLLFVFQQTSGIGVMRTYTTTIFEIADSAITPHIATIIIGVVQVLSGFITPLFVESCGRKLLLLMSTGLASLSLMILAIYFYLYDNGVHFVADIKWLPLVMCIIYFICFTSGFGVIPGTLVGEMFEMDVRNSGTAIVFSFSWLSSVLSVTTFGYIITNAGIFVAFCIFSIVCALAFVFTIFFVPETKGKSLLDVQKMLNK
ncbi:hypothetical protein ABMA27_009572 [Loxostege sticticalis]|uniref:Major facilitator superfamily (MFS) profile domain-containing protein n=1 Tax=Loxostege sticticalis TaxID=481309 RepID=A0ABR3H8T2_LOXSC